MFLFPLSHDTEMVICVTSGAAGRQAIAGGMGWWASRLQEEMQPPRPPPDSTRAGVTGRFRVPRSLQKLRGGWGRRWFLFFRDVGLFSPWSISGSVWVFWKQLEETAGCRRENVRGA